MCEPCKNCKHWTGTEHEHMRTCKHPKMLIGYHNSAEDAGNDGALIEGDEGWGWFTAPEFGCIHFEQNPLLTCAKERSE